MAVTANGQRVAGAFSAHVVNTNHLGADHFSVSIATGADPLMDEWFWADTLDIALEVAIGVDGIATSLVEGFVDNVKMDAVRGVIRVEGRDRAALLIEARTHEAFANQTASEIATLLAARHGLMADAIPTSNPVGRYWQLEHDQLTLDQFSRATTEWDLLAGLARREGYDLWVEGKTLHFRPTEPMARAVMTLRPRATPFGESTVTDMQLSRSLTLARDIEVEVKSWSSRQGRSFRQIARSRRQGQSQQSVQRYRYVIPDLTPDAALQIAQQRLMEITQFERVVAAEMPGELQLTARDKVLVEGTRSSFDQEYLVDTIERSFDLHTGFRQHVRARNVSPGIEVL